LDLLAGDGDRRPRGGGPGLVGCGRDHRTGRRRDRGRGPRRRRPLLRRRAHDRRAARPAAARPGAATHATPGGASALMRAVAMRIVPPARWRPVAAVALALASTLAHAALPTEHWRAPKDVPVYFVRADATPMLGVSVLFDAGARRDPPPR